MAVPRLPFERTVMTSKDSSRLAWPTHRKLADFFSASFRLLRPMLGHRGFVRGSFWVTLMINDYSLFRSGR
jgi:hypothetical protein